MGLVTDVISRLPDFSDSILINREHAPVEGKDGSVKITERSVVLDLLNKKKGYFISRNGSFSKLKKKWIKIDSVRLFPESVGTTDYIKRCDSALSALSDSKTILITTAVGANALQDITPLLLEGLKRRMSDWDENSGYLYIVACENVKRNSTILRDQLWNELGSKKLQKFVDDNVVFCNTTVDRICASIDLCAESNTVEVHAENYFEWVIEKDVRGRTKKLEKLFQGSGIRFVDNIEPYEKRKLWLVNGVHLALATMAINETRKHPNNEDMLELNKALDNFQIKTKLGVFQTEMADALLLATRVKTNGKFKYYFSRSGLAKFNESIIKRIRCTKDNARRVVGELMELGNVENAIADTAFAIYREIRDNEINLSNTPDIQKFSLIMSVLESHLVKMIGNMELSRFFDKVDTRLSEPIGELLKLHYREYGKKGKKTVKNKLRIYQSFALPLEVIKMIGEEYGGMAESLKKGNIIGKAIERNINNQDFSKKEEK